MWVEIQLALVKKRVAALGILLVVVITAWAPWLTNDFAISRVVDKLGGQNRSYNYLGKAMPLSDVPKAVVRLPFCALVYFPGEAVYVVTFFGLTVAHTGIGE